MFGYNLVNMGTDLKVFGEIGTDAVKRLRKSKLAAGKPFMINSKALPAKQSYLEYPDSSISIITITADPHSFTILRKLSTVEATTIRHRFKLI